MGTFNPPKKNVVLVVEDEPLLLMAAVDLVEEAGFEAVEARNADEAIEILNAREDIRIVFTDIDMPGSMDGMKLAAMVRDRWPPVEIIIVSGHRKVADDDLPARSVFFSKPYDVDRVTAQLHAMAA
ncbi:response regulator [Rhizobium sp. CG4]|jgi:DNA-binding NtrC family response regulator|uniref:response regulator n=1 Tax=Rhizobium/Agrobacterium group TaxID=227290 RepID=UPI0020343E7B|nr:MULTISPECIES: response regulator [Rhizobium/Agrobacterium group]MCM2454826.1 response regulator [Rhizobium sp. CG4]MDO5895598.1 response regulator [Agrobacterium sp. Azo12]